MMVVLLCRGGLDCAGDCLAVMPTATEPATAMNSLMHHPDACNVH